MARRRLQTILATTVLVTGLSTMPAWAGPGLDDVTGPVDDVVSTATEAATTADDLVDETVGAVPSVPAVPTPTPTDVETATEVPTDPVDEVVDLEVDVAPSDEDGSPQVEVDGGITAGDHDVDLGSLTDPIEDALDPDPTTPPDTGDSSDDRTGTSGSSHDGTAHHGRPHTTGGGFLAGGGVLAAGADPRPFGTGSDTPFGTGLGHGFAAFGALDRGGFGAQRYGGGTASTSRVPDPEVAPPTAESPQVAMSATQEPETSAVLASGTNPDGADDPATALLRALAAAMVLGTGAVWTRASLKA